MPKRTEQATEQYLRDAALPAKTDTYTVISHGFVIDKTKEVLLAKGFNIERELYRCNTNATVAQGIYHLTFGDDPDMKMMFAWSNSYDKTLKFKCTVGGYVINSLSSVVSDISNWTRKHSGTADDEAAANITSQIEQAESYYMNLLVDKIAMQGIVVPVRLRSEILGRLYFENELLTMEQMGIIKEQFRKPRFKYNAPEDSLWSMYNHIIYALQISHPRTWMDQQRMVHWILTHDPAILGSSTLGVINSIDDSVSKDPAQLNIIDVIQEIEADTRTVISMSDTGLKRHEVPVTREPEPDVTIGLPEGQEMSEEKVERVKELITAHNEGRTNEFTDADGIRNIEVIEPLSLEGRVAMANEDTGSHTTITTLPVGIEMPQTQAELETLVFQEAEEELKPGDLEEKVEERPGDIWYCVKCGEKQGAHKLWNDGKCEECTESEETSANLSS